MKKELRKQIKQDELRTGLDHAVGWAGAHRDEVRVTLIALLVLGLAAVGYGSYRSHRQASAEKAFDEALTIFHAPVVGEPDASLSGETVYPSAAEKNRKAAAAFADVAGRYGSSATGRRARYYAALANREAGKAAEAEAELKALSSGGDDAPGEDEGAPERQLARVTLADVAHVLATCLRATAEDVPTACLPTLVGTAGLPRTSIELYTFAGRMGTPSSSGPRTLADTVDLEPLGAGGQHPPTEWRFAAEGDLSLRGEHEPGDVVVTALRRMALEWGYLDPDPGLPQLGTVRG